MQRAEKKPLILIIDDEKSMLRMLSEALLLEGYAVDTAESGLEGISKAVLEIPDLVLLDVFMAELDGIAVCKIFRETSETRQMPIVCMTGNIDAETKLSCLEAGANDFLAKPIDRVELTARIRNLLVFNNYARAAEENRTLAASRDLTEQMRQDWEDTFDSLEDIITIHDRDYNIIRANKKARDLLGIPPERSGRNKCFYYYHGMEAPPQACPAAVCIEKGVAATVEIFEPYLNKYVEVRVIPRIDKGGTVTGYIHIVRDLTERRSTEEQLKRFIDNSRDMVYRTDAAGIFTMVNQAGAEIFGFKSPAEFLGKKAGDFWRSEEDRGLMIDKIREDKIVKAYPIPARKADGSPIELEATSGVIADEKGTFAGIEGIIRDVTDRNARERELQKRQEELQAKHDELNSLFNKVESIKQEWEKSMDSTHDMVIILNNAGIIKRCNKTFIEFAGMTYEHILLRDWNAVLEECGIELNTLHQHGAEIYHAASSRWFQLTSYPFTDVDNLQSSVITIHDMTEIKNMAEALEITNRVVEENNEKMRNALDELTYIIEQVTKKKDFSPRFANPNLVRCYETMNCGKELCPAHGSDDLRCWQTAGTYCGKKVQGVYAEKFGNCSECAVYKLATPDPVYRIGENFNNMMHILDIQHQELESAYNELKIAQSQIVQQEKMASIGQLAAGVAHEINNPTGFIMSNLGSLRKYMDKLTEFLRIQGEAIDGEQAEAVARQRKALKVDFIIDDTKSLVTESLDGAERIKKIVQDLKNFSRVDEAEQKLTDINAGLESTINIVWNELKYKASVKKEYGEIPQTKCNAGQLNQVFMNMLVNAAHAIEKQGEIRIRTWKEEQSIYVTISDTGSGVPADKLNRIFEPFYTTKEVGKGTGLGLSIAYDIVKKHQGEIRVESEIGKGTTFTVRIPLVEA
ncbi:MAG: PAS domain S-box protein [Thermodesulfovibrionales bacterium]